MPYIKQEDRKQFDSEINSLVDTVTDIKNFHDLYYIIGSLVMKTIKPKRYRQMLEVTGLFMNIRQEFCRRIVGGPYSPPKFEGTPFFAPETEEFKIQYDFEISVLAAKLREGCGDIYGNMNYVITSFLVKTYTHSIGLWSIEILSVLDKLNVDFYDVVAAPYEDLKIEENGDVY